MALEQCGVPVCTVVSEPFAAKCRTEAELAGMADLPLVVVPHPLSPQPPERIGAIADSTLAAVVAAITRPPGEA